MRALISPKPVATASYRVLKSEGMKRPARIVCFKDGKEFYFKTLEAKKVIIRTQGRWAIAEKVNTFYKGLIVPL